MPLPIFCRSQRINSSFRRRSTIDTRPKLDHIDRQFLPEIYELIETPPSPIHLRLMIVICALFFISLAWSYFGWIDIQVVALGKIQPIGRTKIVQSLITGRVKNINVYDGGHVEIGDCVIELDQTESIAERETVLQDYALTEAELARFQAEIRAAGQEHPVNTFSIDFPLSVLDGELKARQITAFKSDVAKLAADLDTLTAQLEEKHATERRLVGSIAARARVIEPLKERVDMQQTLVNNNSGTRSNLISAIRDYEQERTLTAQDDGELGEAKAAVNSIVHKKREVLANFISDATSKILDARRHIDQLKQKIVKSNFDVSNTKVISPISGVAQEISVSSIGQVVTVGQELMSIVPHSVDMEIEAMVSNEDIGFVEIGQTAAIKIAAFPFTRYGTISGRVSRVSTDAIDSRQVGMKPGAGTGSSAAAQPDAQPNGRMTGLVYPITVVLDRDYIVVDGKKIRLTAGMEVSVELRTGERRIIEYLFSPLAEVASRALRER